MGEGVSLVLCESEDIAGSVARDDRLADRLRSMRADAPPVETVLLPGLRSDVFAQRLVADSDGVQDAPAALAPLLEPLTLRDDVLLMVISLSVNMTAHVVRHRATGRLLQLSSDVEDALSEEDRSWLDRECVPAPSDVEATSAALATIADHSALADAHVIVFNVSTFTPEKRHWYGQGDPEPPAIHASRLDLMLDRLASDVPVSVLDVDRVAAEYGAADAVTAAGVYTSEFCDELAEEAMRVIAELPPVSARFSPDAMSLAVPGYDRRTVAGVLDRWHVTAPAEVELGDALFDVRFDHLRSRLSSRRQLETNRTLRLSVVAVRSGYLQSTLRAEGDPVEVGESVGVMTTDATVNVDGTAPAAPFPTGIRLVGR